MATCVKNCVRYSVQLIVLDFVGVSTEIKEILSLLDTGYLLVCHTLKCLFCHRPVVQKDIHFAVMGHVEAALNSESGLNYGIVLEDESGPSFPLIVRVVKEALISLIQSHSAIRHNKEPASRVVSEFTILTQTIMHLVCPPKILHHNCLRFLLGRL